MKKAILALLLFAMPIVVSALPNECKNNVIEASKTDLKDVTFSLEYASDMIDFDGEEVEGYFYVSVPNLPEGYKAVFSNEKGALFVLLRTNESGPLVGGVKKLELLSLTCDTPLKTIEFKVPLYKQFCSGNNCGSDVWFDGTYENTASNQAATKKDTVNKRLIIILAILIVILIISIAIVIKRRKNLEKSF